jgi:hypothetical protein
VRESELYLALFCNGFFRFSANRTDRTDNAIQAVADGLAHGAVGIFLIAF